MKSQNLYFSYLRTCFESKKFLPTQFFSLSKLLIVWKTFLAINFQLIEGQVWIMDIMNNFKAISRIVFFHFGKTLFRNITTTHFFSVFSIQYSVLICCVFFAHPTKKCFRRPFSPSALLIVLFLE